MKFVEKVYLDASLGQVWEMDLFCFRFSDIVWLKGQFVNCIESALQLSILLVLLSGARREVPTLFIGAFGVADRRNGGQTVYGGGDREDHDRRPFQPVSVQVRSFHTIPAVFSHFIITHQNLALSLSYSLRCSYHETRVKARPVCARAVVLSDMYVLTVHLVCLCTE